MLCSLTTFIDYYCPLIKASSLFFSLAKFIMLFAKEFSMLLEIVMNISAYC